MLNFPDFCIRGIRKNDQCFPDQNTVSFTLYMPDTRTREVRDDNGFETSINWEDNNDVIRFTLEYRANGQIAYAHGAVKLNKAHIDYINQLPSSANTLSYERSPLEDNPHHGNIVFNGGLSKARQRMIAGTLANGSSLIIRLEDL